MRWSGRLPVRNLVHIFCEHYLLYTWLLIAIFTRSKIYPCMVIQLYVHCTGIYVGADINFDEKPDTHKKWHQSLVMVILCDNVYLCLTYPVANTDHDDL